MNNDEFKRQYFISLQDLSEESLIKAALPNPELDYFNELMNYIIENQKIYVQDCEETCKLAINYEEQQEYGNYLKIAKMQEKLYLEHLNKRLKKDRSDDIQENAEHKEVLYASSNSKILFEKNLKELLKNDNGEELEGFKKLVEDLKNPDVNFNQQKSRKLTNHTELKDVYELKRFGIRLFYMYVDKYAVVIGASEKKTQNSEKHRQKIINMKYASSDYRKLLEENLNNTKFIDAELQKAQELEEKMMKGKTK